MEEEKINNLWKWFYANNQQIIACMETGEGSDYIVENLDNLILSMGMFSWEVGEGKTKPWSFTISPNGNKQLLLTSQQIIEQAPELDSWEFNPGKPAKEWERKFSIYDNNMDEQVVDATEWHYVALMDEYGMIELMIEANNINHLDTETTTAAANLFINNEIGEVISIEKIAITTIVDELEDKHHNKKKAIQYLKKHIKEL